jgi:Uma2 family endonuclease
VTTAFRFTTRDLEAMPEIEGVRYEIIDGELYVSTAPHWGHQRASSMLTAALVPWSEASRLGEAMPTPGLVMPGEQNVIPDLVWISTARLSGGLDDAGHLTVAPELVVEVLSPGSSNEFRDREVKLDLYSRLGVYEYWIVDWQARLVEVYRRLEAALHRVATRTGSDVLTSPLLPGFACPVASLWAQSGSSCTARRRDRERGCGCVGVAHAPQRLLVVHEGRCVCNGWFKRTAAA